MNTHQRIGVDRFLEVPSRIALAGDWHADTRHGVAAIEHAARRNATVLIHLGDFGYRFTDMYLDTLDDTLRRCGLVLGFVDGNHEDFDRLLAYPLADSGLRYLRERIVHLPRGWRWSWGSTQCLALGGAYSIDRILRVEGTSWWPQEAITVEEAETAVAGGTADAMFCHDCPAGVVVPGRPRERYGFPPSEVAASQANRDRLRRVVDQVRPARLWHGHFHQRHQALLEGAGYRTVVDGLGKNNDPLDNNLVVVNLPDLGHHRWSSRAEHTVAETGSAAAAPPVTA
ncbi:metallophosphoesterase [Rhodococcus sp. IEGM 1318]|uniref:metallophosphoesterase family protein n=1 Tax=Rhodococcus sp. IEGM 1318 TaxID=3082226 RepID=UPI0029541F55|nr:metallophosphoesterase [Rhodococcus sp. IEGM 1318]MDV8009610.1 metallophosphatase [Rhodococcus sp. IEGM 1318]